MFSLGWSGMCDAAAHAPPQRSSTDRCGAAAAVIPDLKTLNEN
jgi:hypothetical protein